jgi:hypothetical protein
LDFLFSLTDFLAWNREYSERVTIETDFFYQCRIDISPETLLIDSLRSTTRRDLPYELEIEAELELRDDRPCTRSLEKYHDLLIFLRGILKIKSIFCTDNTVFSFRVYLAEGEENIGCITNLGSIGSKRITSPSRRRIPETLSEIFKERRVVELLKEVTVIRSMASEVEHGGFEKPNLSFFKPFLIFTFL